MSTSIQSAAASPISIQQWLAEGESLYSSVLREFQTLQGKLAELEAGIAQKAAEVNQIAQVLGKPSVQHSKLAAELVTHYSPELRTSDEALRIRMPATARPALATPRPARAAEAAAR